MTTSQNRSLFTPSDLIVMFVTLVIASAAVLGGFAARLRLFEAGLNKQFDHWLGPADQGSNRVNRRFAQIDGRFGRVDRQFEQRFEHVDRQFAGRFEHVDRQFEQMRQELGQVRKDIVELKVAVARLEGQRIIRQPPHRL